MHPLVQAHGGQGLAALLGEGVEAAAVDRFGQCAQRGQDGVQIGESGPGRLVVQQGQAGRVLALEAVVDDRQQQRGALVGGQPQPVTVVEPHLVATGAQAHDVLAQQRAEHPQDQIGLGRVVSGDRTGRVGVVRCGAGSGHLPERGRGRHEVISQRWAARKSATTRSTVGWSVPVARNTPR